MLLDCSFFFFFCFFLMNYIFLNKTKSSSSYYTMYILFVIFIYFVKCVHYNAIEDEDGLDHKSLFALNWIYVSPSFIKLITDLTLLYPYHFHPSSSISFNNPLLCNIVVYQPLSHCLLLLSMVMEMEEIGRKINAANKGLNRPIANHNLVFSFSW